MGAPELNNTNIWDVYKGILDRFEQWDDIADLIEEYRVYFDIVEENDRREEEDVRPPEGVELRGGLEEANEDGNYYMGGVNNGLGLG